MAEVTPETVFEHIRERSGLEKLTDVPRTSFAVWEDPGGKRLVINLFNPDDAKQPGVCPMDSSHVIVGIFHDEDEIRVYSAPKTQGHPARFCLSKRGRTFVRDDLLDVEVFIDAMADEYRAAGVAAGLLDPDDDGEDDKPDGFEAETPDVGSVTTQPADPDATHRPG